MRCASRVSSREIWGDIHIIDGGEVVEGRLWTLSKVGSGFAIETVESHFRHEDESAP